ncbi:MAG: rhodanese-like domain-containing protein [Alphaproteobacteria bacterium]|nr:rhodanese-like domain-containing protein [Alphaproteobacteria bacterium]
MKIKPWRLDCDGLKNYLRITRNNRSATDMYIDVHNLNTMRRSGDPHTLLDIRESQEVEVCAVDGSLNIAMSELLNRLDELPQEHPLVVMCHVGGRSAQVVQWMRANGFENALNLVGGINAWSAEIDPSLPTY